MKMFYNGAPIKSLNIKHYEVSTSDCTAIPSDLQAGVTCVSKGKKITGTGKIFEFATYGKYRTNRYIPIPKTINVVEVASLQYPVQVLIAFSDMAKTDFSMSQTIGNITIDNIVYPLILDSNNGMFKISCEKTIDLQVFYGKDNYI